MKLRRFLHGATAALAIAVAGVPPAYAQSDPTGEWRVARGVATIRIVDCGGQYWGVLAWEQTPGFDLNNPDPALRGRPMLSMPILLGMTASGPNEWRGAIYNAENGRTYSGSISLPDPDTLQVKGCVLGILCGGERWTRVSPPPAAATTSPPKPPAPKPPARASGARESSQARAQASPRTQSAEEICSGLLNLPGGPHERGLK